MAVQPDIQEFLNKVKQLEKGEKLDLSSDEDLSIAIMNLISIEEHLFFSANKTGKKVYYDLLNQIREMRKTLLKKIIKDYEGEVWCISKHLLAGSMRLMEVGTKMLGKSKKTEAYDMFSKSYQLYSLFWGLNLGVVKVDNLKLNNTQNIELLSDEKQSKRNSSVGIFEKLGQLVKKAVDCCRE